MALTKEKKKEVIEKLKKIVKDHRSLVFTDFNGLTVSESMSVRRSLKEKGVGYVVAKKSLANKVLSEAGFGGQVPDLQGQLGIAYGLDSIEPARGIFEFQKKLEGRVSITGGVFEGNYVDKIKMSELAQIPPRLTLYAQFVNLINSPIQGLVIVLNQVAQKKL